MKDDNLPPDNETVEDGGGCYVAGSREQDAAHSFEKFEGHTPGPWEIDDYKQGILYTHDTGFKFHICIIGSGDSTTMTDEEEIANLALIAEAPNLLAELTRLRSELQQKDELIKDFKKLHNEMLERVIEYEDGITDFGKGKAQAYRFAAKKMNDLLVWHDLKSKAK